MTEPTAAAADLAVTEHPEYEYLVPAPLPKASGTLLEQLAHQAVAGQQTVFLNKDEVNTYAMKQVFQRFLKELPDAAGIINQAIGLLGTYNVATETLAQAAKLIKHKSYYRLSPTTAIKLSTKTSQATGVKTTEPVLAIFQSDRQKWVVIDFRKYSHKESKSFWSSPSPDAPYVLNDSSYTMMMGGTTYDKVKHPFPAVFLKSSENKTEDLWLPEGRLSEMVANRLAGNSWNDFSGTPLDPAVAESIGDSQDEGDFSFVANLKR